MPTLTQDQIISRLQGRIAQLEAGDEIAKKDIYALLTDAQQQALEDALAAQVELKKQKRARTEEEKQALGWKTIREVRLDIMRSALDEAQAGILGDYEQLQRKAELRQMRIYMDAINAMLAKGKDMKSAKIWANNELTRAGLPRLDRQMVMRKDKRDAEIAAEEAAILAQIKREMSPEELEQLELVEELEQQRRKHVAGVWSVAKTGKK